MSWKPVILCYAVAAWLGWTVGPAMAGPEQAAKPKAKTPQERVAEIDGELITLRKQIEDFDYALKAAGCGWGPRDELEPMRRNVQRLRDEKAPEAKIQAAQADFERVELEVKEYERRVRGTPLDKYAGKEIFQERAKWGQRMAELEKERAALRVAPDAKATAPTAK